MITVGAHQVATSVVYRWKETRKLQKVIAFNKIFYVFEYNYIYILSSFPCSVSDFECGPSRLKSSQEEHHSIE